MRARVVEMRIGPATDDSAPEETLEPAQISKVMLKKTLSLWGNLIARIYEINPLECPRCHGQMRIISFVTELKEISEILVAIGERQSKPKVMPARAPPGYFRDEEGSKDAQA